MTFEHSEFDRVVGRPSDVNIEIERLLAEAESAVTSLQAELERARADRDQARQAAQHAEVDRLDEHLTNAQVHWGQVRGFFRAALAEVRMDDGASYGSPPSGAESSGTAPPDDSDHTNPTDGS